MGADELTLDRLLVGSLFNKKEPQVEGDAHPWDDAFMRLLSKLQLFHRVVRSSDQVTFFLSAVVGLPAGP